MSIRDFRRGNYGDRRTYEVVFSSMGENELYALAYYLFEITKDLSNKIVLNADKCPSLYYQLAKNLGLGSRMDDVIKSYIEKLVEKGALTKREKDEYEDDEEENSSRIERYHRRRQDSYVYVEDEDIDSETDFRNVTEGIKDYLRIVFCGDDGIFSQLIYYTFFSKADVNLNKFYNKVPARFIKTAMNLSKVKFLKKELDLSDNESGYLLIRYRKAVAPLFDDVVTNLTKTSAELYMKILGISKGEFNKIVRPDNKLRQFGFINDERCLNPALLECIEAQDLSIYFADLIKPIDLAETYSTGTFSVPENNTEIYKSMLKSDNPISILLYGQPGSGKTEYAKALVKSAGKKALIFKNEAEIAIKNEVLGRLSCLLSLNRKDTVLIVDEADSLLATTMMGFFGPVQSQKSKGIVNKMLETSQNKVIWIVNYKKQIDDSTLRRFTASYKFEAMSPFMLENIAERKLKNLTVSESAKKDILRLFGNYKVTGASVDNMIKVIESMNTKDESSLAKNVEIILKDNSLLLNGKSKIRETVGNEYDLSILNTSIPADKIMKMLRNAKNYADKNPGSGALRMLFYGLSGTGKTELARYISHALGKRILLKRASDIFDKYVGGTEENIASAFSEAAANDMVLLFDEADSFFSDRTKANNNFERTQVNEFLTQLEEFPGIVICTTNLREIMDPAMLRRFHLTVEFNSLLEDGVRTMLKNYFSEIKFSEDDVKKLTKYETVTPGDFGRLCGTIRFLSPEEITAEYIIEELCNFQKEKNKNGCGNVSKKMGFCA